MSHVHRRTLTAALAGLLWSAPVFAATVPPATQPTTPPPLPPSLTLKGPSDANSVALYDVTTPDNQVRLVAVWQGGQATSCALRRFTPVPPPPPPTTPKQPPAGNFMPPTAYR